MARAREDADYWKLHETLWKYFEFHANQRLTTFNYFVVISTVATTGLVSLYSAEKVPAEVPAALSLVIMLSSYVFSRLDKRNCALIHRAEAGLIELERQHCSVMSKSFSELTTPFSNSKRKDSEIYEKTSMLFRSDLTFSESFRIIFVLVGLVAFCLFLTSIFRVARVWMGI